MESDVTKSLSYEDLIKE